MYTNHNVAKQRRRYPDTTATIIKFDSGVNAFFLPNTRHYVTNSSGFTYSLCIYITSILIFTIRDFSTHIILLILVPPVATTNSGPISPSLLTLTVCCLTMRQIITEKLLNTSLFNII